jgi:cytochrome c-type biogenesis protein CcmH/NrfF
MELGADEGLKLAGLVKSRMVRRISPSTVTTQIRRLHQAVRCDDCANDVLDGDEAAWTGVR